MKNAMKFLKTYKGKNADMKIDKKLASMSEAFQLIEESHLSWRNGPINSNSETNIISTSTNSGRVRVIKG